MNSRKFPVRKTRGSSWRRRQDWGQAPRQGAAACRRPPAGRGLGGQGEACHGEQVLALGWSHPQHACQALDHLAADADTAALLQPGVPGDADPGQLASSSLRRPVFVAVILVEADATGSVASCCDW